MRASLESLTTQLSLDDVVDEKHDVVVVEGMDLILPPRDGGRQAWLFMIGSVIVDAVIWGECCPSASLHIR